MDHLSHTNLLYQSIVQCVYISDLAYEGLWIQNIKWFGLSTGMGKIHLIY